MRVPLGWIIVGAALLAWSPVIAAGYVTATLTQMRANPTLYLPTACRALPCVLTGLGGFIETWDNWADAVMARGWGFIVRGICASACEREYRRALAAGAPAQVAPGAVLIYHAPELVRR